MLLVLTLNSLLNRGTGLQRLERVLGRMTLYGLSALLLNPRLREHGGLRRLFRLYRAFARLLCAMVSRWMRKPRKKI